MKKLKLNSTAFAGAEVLSRTELKNVMGGLAAPGDGGHPGGNNGNPRANDACAQGGGYIVCQDSDGNSLIGNCNENGNPSGSHNGCVTTQGDNYWC